MAFTADRACGPYVRGRLWMAGIRPATALSDALDVIEVVMLETPQDVLVKHRRRLDMQTAIAEARAGTYDRDAWGTSPEQQAAMAPLMGGG